MTISLNVAISKASESDYYFLKVDSLEHSIIRMPTQAPIPANEGAATSNIFGLDLAMAIPQITITGIVDEVVTDYSTTHNPTKQNLEDVAYKWFVHDLTNNYQSALRLAIGSKSYYCAIKSLTFRMEGGLEDRWTYSLILLAYNGATSS